MSQAIITLSKCLAAFLITIIILITLSIYLVAFSLWDWEGVVWLTGVIVILVMLVVGSTMQE